MKKKLIAGDTVYTPRTDFSSGHHWLEEKRVKKIAADYIILVHVADLRKNGENLVRIEVQNTEFRGGEREIAYYSRSLEEIADEYKIELDWFVNRIFEDKKKFDNSN